MPYKPNKPYPYRTLGGFSNFIITAYVAIKENKHVNEIKKTLYGKEGNFACIIAAHATTAFELLMVWPYLLNHSIKTNYQQI